MDLYEFARLHGIDMDNELPDGEPMQQEVSFERENEQDP